MPPLTPAKKLDPELPPREVGDETAHKGGVVREAEIRDIVMT